MRALLALLVCGCTSTAKPPPPAPPPTSAPKTIDLSDPLALLPAESDLVVTVDLPSLRKSALWTKYESDVLRFIAPSLAACGYNPMADVSTITAGVPMGNTLGMFVVRGVDREKTLSCLRKSTVDPDETAEFDGEFVALKNKSGFINMITFVGAKTMVMQGSRGPTKQTLQHALQLGAPLRRDGAFVALEATATPGAALKMVSHPNSTSFAELLQKRLGAPARHLVATVHVVDGLTARIAIAMERAEQTVAIVEAMRPQLESFRQHVKRYDMRADGPTLIIDVAVTEAQLEAFAAMLKPLLGNLGTN